MDRIEKEKSLLELQYNYLLNYLNIFAITILGIIVTVWLSADITIVENVRKIDLTIGAVLILFFGSLIFHISLGNIKEKIKGL